MGWDGLKCAWMEALPEVPEEMTGLKFIPWFMLWDGVDTNTNMWSIMPVYKPQSSLERIAWEDLMRRYRRRC